MSEDEEFEKYLFGKGWHKSIVQSVVLWQHADYNRYFKFDEAIRTQAKATRMRQAGRKGGKRRKYVKKPSKVFRGHGGRVATSKQIEAHLDKIKRG